MGSQITYLFITLALTLLLYPFWIRFVYRFHMGEEIRGDGPKAHLTKKGTPTMGGLVFIATVAIVTFFLNRSRDQTLFPLFVAILAGIFGILEDFSKVYKHSGLPGLFSKIVSPITHKKQTIFSKYNPWTLFKDFWRIVGSSTEKGGLQTYQKFLIQGIIAGFVSYWTYFKLGWDYIWLPLIGNVHISFLYPIFVFVLFIAVLNSVAFTDGLDGLAGGLAALAFAGYWAIATSLGYNSLAYFCATFIGSLLPFLYFNIFPARIFMGNVGSHVLGATLAVLGIVMHREFAIIVLLAVFMLDGISSPLQQLSVIFTKKRIFRMAPLHHHFEMLGWPEAKVTMRFWLFGAFFAFLGVLTALM